MKTKLLPVVCCMLLTCHAINSKAQANETLSNLISPTAVNQSLLPGTSNTINLGSGGRGALSWKNLYLGNALYLKGKITLHAPGTGNFFVGSNAGNTSLTGINNTGTGQFSLHSLTTGNDNIATGYGTLHDNSTGSTNIAIGNISLYSNTTGYSNIANGFEALYSNMTGYENIANGVSSLYSNTGGYENTANGTEALYNNTTGFLNSADGYETLYYNTSGNYNTAGGYFALGNNISGIGNTASGSFSLASNTDGSYVTTLGYGADVSGILTNATAIGFDAMVDASSKVRIGNFFVTSIGGAVGWTIFSDGRYKKDIQENVSGLAFINSLRPITYTVNVQGLNEYYNKGRKQVSNNAVSANEEAVNAEMKRGEDEASKIVYNGFIAQEVEEAAKKLNYEFSGVDKPQSKDGLYGLRYDNFVVPLVKAVQELSKMNDDKDEKIAQLTERIVKLEQVVETHVNTSVIPNDKQQTKNISSALLAQNVPNPFSNSTSIKYALPQKFTTAQIIITDKNGKQLKQLNISGSGNGSLNIDASTLSSGAYNYSLIVDGKVISSKQMILVK
jgi:hypothetical protein